MAQISFRAFNLWCHQSKSAVCVYTGESSSCRVDTAIIQKRLPVLHKYLNSDTERQLQALYALQALIVKLDQPPSEYKLSFQLCSILRPCSLCQATAYHSFSAYMQNTEVLFQWQAAFEFMQIRYDWFKQLAQMILDTIQWRMWSGTVS